MHIFMNWCFSGVEDRQGGDGRWVLHLPGDKQVELIQNAGFNILQTSRIKIYNGRFFLVVAQKKWWPFSVITLFLVVGVACNFILVLEKYNILYIVHVWRESLMNPRKVVGFKLPQQCKIKKDKYFCWYYFLYLLCIIFIFHIYIFYHDLFIYESVYYKNNYIAEKFLNSLGEAGHPICEYSI